LRTAPARAALANAARAAAQAGIPPLSAEVEAVARVLTTPAARLIADGNERLLLLEEVEALLASPSLVVDATRNAVRAGGAIVSLDRRPVLFALARVLAESWPGDASRTDLLRRAFRARQADDSHRARLRVEIGRTRAALRGLAGIHATPNGFRLMPDGDREVVVLAQPIEDDHAAVLALLGDGEAWASSALALALGISQRSVQRALERLAETGKAQPFGRGRARRWVAASVPGFPTGLLLPSPLASR
ncbi:MAG: helix-turn-helix domain-containing protein, partial [Bauldia litoralis]